MFGGLRRVVLQISDIKQAKDWYSKVFGVDPLMEAPFAVAFKIEDSELILTPNSTPISQGNPNAVAFWKVDDVELEYNRLLQLGATSHTEIKTVFGTRRAQVVDPFGNIFGIMSSIKNDNSKPVEEKPSQTAAGVTFLRALAATDEREEIRGSDYLAAIFLTEDESKPLKDPAIREQAMKKMPAGMYEYLIARTAYFDNVVKEAFQKNIPQMVFLGAGYDSRVFRFKKYIKDTKIFELDIPTTQERKRAMLSKANIPLPQRLHFIPINFNTDNLKEVLLKAGFDSNQTSLFIWEGVTYYLSPKVMDDTLSFIHSNSPAGSQVVFDYIAQSSTIWEESGVFEASELMKSQLGGEPIRFTIKNGEIETFLETRGYQLMESLSANEMEKRYLTLQDGSLAGKVLPSLGIACGLVGDK